MGSRRELLRRWHSRLHRVEERLRRVPGASFRGHRLIRRKVLAYLTARYGRDPLGWFAARAHERNRRRRARCSPTQILLRPQPDKPPRSAEEIRASLLRIHRLLRPDESSSRLRPV